jgi:hypothetical protein
MIRDHEFNSRWYGERCGVLEDLSFFASPQDCREKILDTFALVELRAPLISGLPMNAIRESGFFQADTQIHFRIGLGAQAGMTVGDELEVVSGDNPSFDIGEGSWSLFEFERYRFLPDMSRDKINGRYARWAADLASRSPSSCLQFFLRKETQGWFFSQPDQDSRLNLTLAVLHEKATVPGLMLYARSLKEYARLGYRSGWASFSVANTAVHNIYAQLGARFEIPMGIWLRIRPVHAGEAG